jgi:carbonic anhydrase/acetyltransferase-like protein (isoleucine patch superfamily)
MKKRIYIAPDAVVTGDVALGDRVNIWYGAVLRGDSGRITIGDGTNIQDRCILHEETTLGKNCTVGHGAIVHGCTIGDNTLVGMGAIILNGAKIGNNCIIGAGALVTGKIDAPDGSVILGSPAKVVKEATPEQIDDNLHNAEHYVQSAQTLLTRRGRFLWKFGRKFWQKLSPSKKQTVKKCLGKML